MLVRDVSADVWAESLCGLPSDQHPYAACRRISAGSSEVTIGLEGLARSVVARHRVAMGRWRSSFPGLRKNQSIWRSNFNSLGEPPG